MCRSVVVCISLAALLGPAPAVCAGEPAVVSAPVALPPASSVAPAALCAGDYADEPSVLLPRVREYEREPRNQYSYCLRTSAIYECLSYGTDGTIRKSRRTAVAHGTGFAYRRSGTDTLLVTNDHVASWPAVTDEQHPVEEVPGGCKRVSESVKIVDDESDDYEPNDVPLARVVTDPAADVAVLKTRVALALIPYKIGRSAPLRVGNAVAVHGFPLGAFAATNLGKVVNAFDHDTDKDWDHADFVVDALLSPGNSGSPVLAVSCRTGEYELVGIYHAGYVRGSALNVVVGIDQVRELLATLKRTPRTSLADATLGPADRALVAASLGGTGSEALPPFPFFPLGPLVASVRPLDGGTLVYEVYSRGFPLRDERLLVVEDLVLAGDPTGFGAPGRVYFGSGRGLREWPLGSLDADGQALLERVLGRLRAAASWTARFRAADEASSRGHKERAAVEREMVRGSSLDQEAAQSVLDLAERLGPRSGEASLGWRSVLVRPAVQPSPVTQRARR